MQILTFKFIIINLKVSFPFLPLWMRGPVAGQRSSVYTCCLVGLLYYAEIVKYRLSFAKHLIAENVIGI